jgi:hypothetical protein
VTYKTIFTCVLISTVVSSSAYSQAADPLGLFEDNKVQIVTTTSVNDMLSDLKTCFPTIRFAGAARARSISTDTEAQGGESPTFRLFLFPGLRAFGGQLFRAESGGHSQPYIEVSIVGSGVVSAKSIIDGLPKNGLRFQKAVSLDQEEPFNEFKNREVAGGYHSVSEVWTTPPTEVVSAEATVLQGAINTDLGSTKLLVLKCRPL